MKSADERVIISRSLAVMKSLLGESIDIAIPALLLNLCSIIGEHGLDIADVQREFELLHADMQRSTAAKHQTRLAFPADEPVKRARRAASKPPEPTSKTGSDV
jgi:hypothetical protein